jgi:hypothetical protein
MNLRYIKITCKKTLNQGYLTNNLKSTLNKKKALSFLNYSEAVKFMDKNIINKLNYLNFKYELV